MAVKFLRHDSVELPPDSSRIWRYLDIPKLLQLLQSRELRLTRCDLFTDPWEGAWPKGILDAFRAMRPPVKKAPDFRAYYYVSCWHESESESAALWDLYAAQFGVAIQTTVGALSESISSDKRLHLGRVRYIDYDNYEERRLNALIPPFLKRRSFSHEREVRILRWNTEQLDGAEIEDSKQLRVDPAKLIERIFISPSSPPWWRPVLEDVCNRYGVVAEVIRSSLYDPLVR